MFYAICKSTDEKVNSLTIEEDPRYQFIIEEMFYADPDEIYSCNDGIDITKIEVKFRKGKRNIINWNGTQYTISPCFYIPNKEKLGINTIPESKEHKNAKNFIYDKIKKQSLILSYSQLTKPYKYTKDINLFDLPIDYKKIGIEVTSSKIGNLTSRRADIILPFIVKHPILGNGVVIEIQFSRQYKKTKVSRELDWAIRGFSVAWIFKKDFDLINDKMIIMKNEKIKVDSFANLIKENNKSFVRNLKFEVQSLVRQLDYEKENFKRDIQNQINKELQIDKDELLNELYEDLKKLVQPICPKCNTHARLINYNGEKFWGCSNHPRCKWSSAYDG